MKRLGIFLLAALLLAGCSQVSQEETTPVSTEVSVETVPEADFSGTDSDMFTDRDQRTGYDAGGAIRLTLREDGATANSGAVAVEGDQVILKEEATYIISGTFNGSLVVDAPETAKLQLVFDGVQITGQTFAPVYIKEADKVFITLAEGSENTLTNGGSFVAVDENNVDGALFSRQDLTLNGSGALTVVCPAGHGIVCKDDLVITGGSYTIQAAGHGLDANDSIRIADGQLSIHAGKDALHADNAQDGEKGFVYISGGTIQAEAEGDGIAASGYLQILEGRIDLLVGGGSENGTKASSGNYGGFMGGPGGSWYGPDTTAETETTAVSMKGLKAANSLQISGGNITVDSADDAIHSDTSVYIHGGILTLASGDDAIHGEESLQVTDGDITISESYEGLEALHITVAGGKLRLTASDDGINAAGGTDQSGFTGGRDGMFGGGGKHGPGGRGPGGMGQTGGGSILISGGQLQICASGDGLDANGTLEITGGYTVVEGPNRGDTATLDYDVSGGITGGTFIGTGASGMAQSFSDSGQGVIALNVGSRSAGTEVCLQAADGTVLLRHTPQLDYGVVILSCPEMVKGESYTVTIGTDTDTFTAA